MSQNLSEESLIRDYILHELPEDEQDDLEKRLLADPELFETSRIIEGELLDDYVRGYLSQDDRVRLEQGLLKNPQQYLRVQLIRTLEQFLRKPAAPDRDYDELNEPAGLEAPGLRVLIEEEATARKYVTTRYQILIDRKYEQGLSPSENEELEGLKAALDKMDEPYYDAIIKRLSKIVEERGV
jgi:hypothetical protein